MSLSPSSASFTARKTSSYIMTARVKRFFDRCMSVLRIIREEYVRETLEGLRDNLEDLRERMARPDLGDTRPLLEVKI